MYTEMVYPFADGHRSK